MNCKIKKILKLLLNLKWENIFLLVFIPLGFSAMASHDLEHFTLFVIESLVYIAFPIIIWYCIKDFRQDIKKYVEVENGKKSN